jgi:hypothetical protein
MPKFVSNIDLVKNELQNARIQTLTTDPANPVSGQIYFNTVDGRLKVYDGTAWRYASALFTDADISPTAAIANTKLATNPLDRTNHINTQTASTISDFDTQVRTNRLDQMSAPTGPVSFNQQAITNLADPTNPQDATNKRYVDSAVQGIDWKPSVRAATTTNISSLFGLMTVDGVELAAGNRVLVKNQDDGEDNGIYVVVDSNPWVRASDADTNAEVTASFAVFVEEGTTNRDSGWVLTNNGTITIGTTELVFVQFTGLGQIEAGDGLTQTANRIDVVGTADRITANSNNVDIASTYVGQTSITTLGTITTGVWNGTDVAVADGGTGASDAAGAKTNLGFMTRYTQTIGDGATNPITVTHSMNTRDVMVQVRETASPYEHVGVTVESTTTNTVTLTFGTAPTLNQYTVIVIG